MKKVVMLFLLVSISLTAQKKVEKLESYTASNGVTYKLGDEFKLEKGSDTNGKFVYVLMGGWAMSTNNAEANRLPAANAGLIVTVKKIKKYNYKRYKGVYFTVGGGNITNYIIDIENAIGVCEIKPCTSSKEAQPKPDKYDQLKKLKELLDSGVLSQDEFDSEKKKLLKQ